MSTKYSQPVDLLSSEVARIVNHVHPVVLLSALYFRFPSLVADPVSMLTRSWLPVAIVQILYASMCLPPTGSKGKMGKKTKAEGKSATGWDISNRLLVIFLSLSLSLFAVVPITLLQILMGAPATTHLPQTLLTSSHIALLTIFPLVYVHGIEKQKWREILALWSPLDEVFGGAVGCLVGAWLGAVPIPLDWDREWQKWPVTIVTGVYTGYILGKTTGSWLLRGKRIELD